MVRPTGRDQVLPPRKLFIRIVIQQSQFPRFLFANVSALLKIHLLWIIQYDRELEKDFTNLKPEKHPTEQECYYFPYVKQNLISEFATKKVLAEAVMHPSSDTIHVENTSRCHSEAPLSQCCTPVPSGTEPSFTGTSFNSFLYLRLNKEGLRRKQWRITAEDICCVFGDLLSALLFMIWKYYFSYYLLYWFVAIFQSLSHV